MTLHTPENGWKDMTQQDRNFLYELGVSAIAAAAIVFFLG
jgi:hypothetical protein